MSCTIGEIDYETIYIVHADDIVFFLGTSARKMQKMIDICCKYGNKYGITLNPAKTNWIYSSICNNVSFDINGIVIQNVGLSIKYLYLHCKSSFMLIVVLGLYCMFSSNSSNVRRSQRTLYFSQFMRSQFLISLIYFN